MDLQAEGFGSGPATDSPERAKSRRGGDAAASRRLVQTIEGDIIPRLLLMHRTAAVARADTVAATPAGAAVGADDVRDLAARSVGADDGAVWERVRELRCHGVALDSIGLDLLAPTARLLGEMWVEDLCDFTQVTVGLTRLRQALRRLAPEFDSEALDLAPATNHDKRVLLAPLPGEHHNFGLILVADFLRRDGWIVHEAVGATLEELVTLVRDSEFSIVGLSIACAENLGCVATTIAALRRAAVRRPVGIMVGGVAFDGDPDRALRVGADATGMNARSVRINAAKLLGVLRARM